MTQRALARLRRVPSVPEAARVLDQLGLGRRLGAAARSLLRSLGSVRRRPLAVVDSVLAWVGQESAGFRTVEVPARLQLSFGLRDVALVASAIAPACVLLLPL